METQQQFKRGQRVRYVGDWFGRYGKLGTIMGMRPWITVRFDGEEKRFPSSPKDLEHIADRSAPK
jgi:hypothetical protein